MKKKIKNKKILVIIIISVILVISSFFVIDYFNHNFDGIVVEKYDVASEFHTINITSNHIKVNVNGEIRDYVVNDKIMFDSLELGKTYSFKKDRFVQWVTVKE